MSLNFYHTRDEKITYVGWLLACDSTVNTAKGKRLLAELPDDLARIAAHAHAAYLTELYNEV